MSKTELEAPNLLSRVFNKASELMFRFFLFMMWMAFFLANVHIFTLSMSIYVNYLAAAATLLVGSSCFVLALYSLFAWPERLEE